MFAWIGSCLRAINWGRWLLLLAALAVLGSGIGLALAGIKRSAFDAGYAKAQAEQRAAQAALAQRQATLSQRIDAQAVAAQAAVRTVFKDRIIYRTQKAHHAVTAALNQATPLCPSPNIPVAFVELWDSANRATAPDAARSVDASPSGLALADVSAQKDVEAELCHANTQQLIDLQAWVRAQAALSTSSAQQAQP